jgi:tetratricopeptide (TPR) repeat protein
LFVLFASIDSLESPWVNTEIKLAQESLYSGKLGGIIVFIIDELNHAELPSWLTQYVFIKSSNPIKIANKIRADLISLDLASQPSRTIWVGRAKEIAEIEERLSDLTSDPPNLIYVSGAEGIGRRSLLHRVLGSIYPSYDIKGIETSLTDSEGSLELLFKLYVLLKSPVRSELDKLLTDFQKMEISEQVKQIALLIADITSEKQFLWLNVDAGAITENGVFQPWLYQLIRELPSKQYPQLIIVGRRMPSFETQRKNKNVACFKIESLNPKDSEKLWIFALQQNSINAPKQFILELNKQITGHPSTILATAEYIKQMGHAVLIANNKSLLEQIRALSYSLVDNISFSENEEELLALFEEFNILPATDIAAIFGNDDTEISKALIRLLDFGILEPQGDFLQLAPYLINAQLKQKFSKNTATFIIQARKKLLTFSENYKVDDQVSIATIEATTLAAIKEGKQGFFSDRSLLGSHFLRVARDCYDKKSYSETITFCHKAFDKQDTLTINAKTEVLRLMGMSAIRISKDNALDFAIDNLEKLNLSAAKRHIYFMRGFNNRWHGKFSEAEKEFREALRYQESDFHILRELATTLVEMENYSEAEKFARSAFLHSRQNPYLLDILLCSLIERLRPNPFALNNDVEIQDLFERLEIADKREKKSFYSMRKAHFFSVLKNPSVALEWANKAVSENPNLLSVHLTRAEIKMKFSKDSNTFQSVKEDFKKIQDMIDKNGGRKSFVSSLNKLKIYYDVAKGNYTAAIETLEKSSSILKHLKQKLSVFIATEIAHSGSTDKHLVEWVKRNSSK